MINNLPAARQGDSILEAVGPTNSIVMGCTTVMIGMAKQDQKIDLNVHEVFMQERKILGSFYGSANVNTDFKRMLDLWKDGKLDLEAMITRRIDLSEINEAFAAMLKGEVIRSVIEYR